MITPLIINGMFKGRQIKYKEGFKIYESGKLFSVLINADDFDDVNFVCDFFGYILDCSESYTDDLVQVTYRFLGIPGL